MIASVPTVACAAFLPIARHNAKTMPDCSTFLDEDLLSQAVIPFVHKRKTLVFTAFLLHCIALCKRAFDVPGQGALSQAFMSL